MSKPEQFYVRNVKSGRTGFTSYHVFRVGGGRVSVHAYGTRDAAQAHADELNIGALVKDYVEDPRPYAVRLEEARQAYAAQPNPGYCAGCGQTFNGRQGLRAHQSQRYITNACKGIGE